MVFKNQETPKTEARLAAEISFTNNISHERLKEPPNKRELKQMHKLSQERQLSERKKYRDKSSPWSDRVATNMHKSPIRGSNINKKLLISPMMPEDLMGRMAGSNLSRFNLHGKENLDKYI